MKLRSFSALVAGSVAGLVLSGCAVSPQAQQTYGGYAYANAAPALVPVYDSATGRNVLVPAQQQPQYQSGYGQPRYPAAYGVPMRQPQNQLPLSQGPNASGLVGAAVGALAGNAIRHGNGAVMAAGAVAGYATGSATDPCAAPTNAGTIVGGLAGGALGNQVGRGSGQKTATVLGAIAGAVLGGNVASGPRPPGCR